MSFPFYFVWEILAPILVAMRRELQRKSGSKGERVDREGTWRIENEDVTQEANKKKRAEWTCGGRGKERCTEKKAWY